MIEKTKMLNYFIHYLTNTLNFPKSTILYNYTYDGTWLVDMMVVEPKTNTPIALFEFPLTEDQTLISVNKFKSLHRHGGHIKPHTFIIKYNEEEDFFFHAELDSRSFFKMTFTSDFTILDYQSLKTSVLSRYALNASSLEKKYLKRMHLSTIILTILTLGYYTFLMAIDFEVIYTYSQMHDYANFAKVILPILFNLMVLTPLYLKKQYYAKQRQNLIDFTSQNYTD